MSIQAFWAWGLLALVPFVGLIAYIVMRPGSYALDREEQELDMARGLPQLAHSHPSSHLDGGCFVNFAHLGR